MITGRLGLTLNHSHYFKPCLERYISTGRRVELSTAGHVYSISQKLLFNTV